MSRRGAVIEEVDDDDDFNDDTDLPLPSLPNTGARGPLLQEIDDPAIPPPPKPQTRQTVSPLQSQSAGETSASGETITVDPVTGRKTVWVQDGSAYKTWTSLYPIYFDAKRPYGGTERRIPRDKSVWWPLSPDIVDACSHLGLRTLHEPSKRHPKDWENPGRVKVSFRIDGRLQHPSIKTKKQLLEAIGRFMQQANPDLIPSPDAAITSDAARASTSSPADEDTKPSTNKKEKAKTVNHVRTAPSPKRRMKSRLPQPPPGPSRLSQFSPAQEASILIETVKAGMNAPASGEGTAGPASLGGKGKRKIVRVRG